MSKAYYKALITTRGIFYTFLHFINAHLFDLIHKTDTHIIVTKDQYLNPPSNLIFGTFYQASWTSEIVKTFIAARKILGNDFDHYHFVDIGCGKGKVVILWRLLCQRSRLSQSISGIDYHLPFIEIARQNHSRVFGDAGNLLTQDVEDVDFSQWGKSLIVYLFNPFDFWTLGRLLDKLAGLEHLILYNYPLHKELLLQRGYRCLYAHAGFYDIEKTMILKPPSRRQV